MTDSHNTGVLRPGHNVITASGAHVGTVVETRPPFFCVVTLRGTFWFDTDAIEEVTRDTTRLVCEYVDLEKYAKPEPERRQPGH